MCVTSAPASASSLAASAAILALYEPVRMEPAKTMILGSGIGGSRMTGYDRCRAVSPPSSGSSPAIHPHTGGREIEPDALGGLGGHADKRLRDRRHGRISELDERRSR